MRDTGFYVPAAKQSRFAACYQNLGTSIALYDDPQTSAIPHRPRVPFRRRRLVSTSADYLRFCRMMLNRGELDGVRYLSRKTVDLMTANHIAPKSISEMSVSMFTEAAYAGTGYGLGVAVNLDPAKTLVPGSAGEYFWGGMASTAFWIDPKEELIVIFMTQLLPSSSTNIRPRTADARLFRDWGLARQRPTRILPCALARGRCPRSGRRGPFLNQ